MPINLKDLMLRKPALTLAVAESMTCGQVQALIGAISGASEFFLGGMTAYALDGKVRHLGVDRDVAEKTNCVSAEVADQMARGVCEFFDSDLGIATTGYAEAAKASGVNEPFAWWALAHRHKGRTIVRSGRVECMEAKRVEAQVIVAEAAIAELREYLREFRG